MGIPARAHASSVETGPIVFLVTGDNQKGVQTKSLPKPEKMIQQLHHPPNLQNGKRKRAWNSLT